MRSVHNWTLAPLHCFRTVYDNKGNQVVALHKRIVVIRRKICAELLWVSLWHAKQAKAMIEETLLPLVEVAVATGFASICAMSKTVRDEYGASPSKMRDRKKIRLLTFAE